MGLVYEAEDLSLGRRVALKFLPEELLSERTALDRFRREARAASASDHPNICTIYEVGEHEGSPFIAMQLLQGQTLSERIETGGRKPIAFPGLIAIAIQVTDGLAAAHQQGIIHRDIKPANIFLTARGEAKILDFGLAKLANTEEHPQTNAQQGGQESGHSNVEISRLGATMGTAPYMSPEQLRGEKLDARSDLFSFGLVLYEMATGKRAFAGNTIVELQHAVLAEVPARVSDLNPEAPPEFQAVVSRALEKDRGVRYQSAAEMGADLRSLGGSLRLGPAALPVLPFSAAGKPQPKRRWPWVVVGCAVLLVVVALALNFLLQRREQSRLTEKDTILIAAFSNSTGDAIFDDSLQLGLTTSLRQSPFLDIVPTGTGTVRRVLTSMTLPPDTPLLCVGVGDICQCPRRKAV